MFWLAVACLFTIHGPALDALEGSTATAEDRRWLPSGRNISHVTDLWFVDIVNLRASGAGISTFDAPALSSHGWSWTEMRYSLGGIDITDPARPGTPLLEMPHGLWQSLHYQSLWARGPQLSWDARRTTDDPGVRARGNFGGELGGGTWVPRKFMDREPAVPHGATTTRRAVVQALEAEAEARWGCGRIAAEHIDHQHRYPTLRDARSYLLMDNAQRTTVLASGECEIGARPYRLLGAWQGVDRSHAGAEYRHTEAMTLEQRSNAAVLQLGTVPLRSRDLEIDAKVGVAIRDETMTPHTSQPLVSDLEDEWMWMHRPRFGEDLRRERFDVNLVARIGEAQKTTVRLDGNRQSLHSSTTVPGGRTATTYLRAADSNNRAVSLTQWTGGGNAEEWLHNLRVEGATSRQFGDVNLRLVAALDYAGAGFESRPAAEFASPAAGLAVTMPIGKGEIFFLLRHEPTQLTAELTEFVDPNRPSWTRYGWNDDGDLKPESGETGALLARGGGKSHKVDQDLRRPSSNLLTFGWRSPRFGPFRFVAHGIARALRNRYTVVLDGPAAQSYERMQVGELAVSQDNVYSQDHDLDVYARTPGSEGEERYLLTNASRPHWFVGSQIQLVTDVDSWWFLNLGATGYWSLGVTPFGLFPDRNDIGIIDEVSADPNARVNQHGSVDSGRAYHINLAAGINPWSTLTAAVAIRYVDGEPMSRMLVIEDLPQGPTTLMGVARGDPVPRYTFHMTVDLKAQYTHTIGPTDVTFSAELYNLLGSGTEILENVASGNNYRRSVEMMPGRAMLVGIEAQL